MNSTHCTGLLCRTSIKMWCLVFSHLFIFSHWSFLDIGNMLHLCPFTACPPGSYKMSSRQQECFPCPANSVAEEDGSVVCVCKEDHFRTPLDTPSAPCTSNPVVPCCPEFDVMSKNCCFSRIALLVTYGS